MMKTWKNEPFELNVARAHTLDAGWYLDPQVFDLEMERIFARTWQAAARLSDLSKPGDYLATDAAGEPIVVLRDQQNQIRAYYNVCPHRAGALARGKGSRKTLQCLYHGWTFGLDGCLLRVPGFEGTEDFDPTCFGLKEIRTEVWGPYVFVNLDERAPCLAQIWGDHDAQTMDSMIKFADEVQYQDIEICEYVQKNLHSRAYNSGRFSARHENGVHHFQSLVVAFMNSPEQWPVPLFANDMSLPAASGE
jgi:phenylpropionate dioxygenase-like ring-hydroxylating dioxygenase large terminal subunit